MPDPIATAPARQFRPTWVHWTVATVLVVVIGAVAAVSAVAMHGQRRLRTVTADLVATGMGTTIDDLAALTPADLDPLRQEEWWAWQQAMEKALSTPAPLPSIEAAVLAWLAHPGEPPPQALLDRLAVTTGPMGEARRLLASGPIFAGTLGWLRRDLPPAGSRSAFTAPRGASFQALREAGEWLRLSALAEARPDAVLADLDALYSALADHPASLIETMIALGVATKRDRCHLELALLGRLPAEARRRWLDERPDHLRQGADGFRGERLLMTAQLSRLDAGGHAGEVLFAEVLLPLDIAVLFENQAAIERRLRGTAPAFPDLGDLPHLAYIARIALPSLAATPAALLKGATDHRCVRLALRLIDLAGHPVGLPADEPALLAALGDANLLDPGGDMLRLRYERLGPAMFRVAVDPATPVPDFAAGMLPTTSIIGTPPPSGTPLLIGSMSVHVDLSAQARVAD